MTALRISDDGRWSVVLCGGFQHLRQQSAPLPRSLPPAGVRVLYLFPSPNAVRWIRGQRWGCPIRRHVDPARFHVWRSGAQSHWHVLTQTHGASPCASHRQALGDPAALVCIAGWLLYGFLKMWEWEVGGSYDGWLQNFGPQNGLQVAKVPVCLLLSLFSWYPYSDFCAESSFASTDGNRGLTPFLESMLLLVTALVRLGPTTALKELDGSQTCVLLENLSNATDLELVAESRVVHLFLPYLLVSVLALLALHIFRKIVFSKFCFKWNHEDYSPRSWDCLSWFWNLKIVRRSYMLISTGHPRTCIFLCQ
jgi:hypothetical protein